MTVTRQQTSSQSAITVLVYNKNNRNIVSAYYSRFYAVCFFGHVHCAAGYVDQCCGKFFITGRGYYLLFLLVNTKWFTRFEKEIANLVVSLFIEHRN